MLIIAAYKNSKYRHIKEVFILSCQSRALGEEYDVIA